MQKHSYQGLPIQGTLESNNPLYLDRLLSTMSTSLAEHPRTYAIQVDLRLPDLNDCHDGLSRDEMVSYNRKRTNLMKRFTESLSAKVKAQGVRMRKEGKRVYPCTVRYVWVKERTAVINDHYHIVLFFNKDRFHKAGDYKWEGSLASMIIESWASALKCNFDDGFGLVNFPEYHGYYLNENSQEFLQQRRDLFHRISYLAKKRTKHYGEGSRCFGCSSR
jgi:hypothetical protein